VLILQQKIPGMGLAVLLAATLHHLAVVREALE
jgi:hypothetical protein